MEHRDFKGISEWGRLPEVSKENKETKKAFQLFSLGDWENNRVFNKNGAICRGSWLRKGMELSTDL